jgi:hypothetical protein
MAPPLPSLTTQGIESSPESLLARKTKYAWFLAGGPKGQQGRCVRWPAVSREDMPVRLRRAAGLRFFPFSPSRRRGSLCIRLLGSPLKTGFDIIKCHPHHTKLTFQVLPPFPGTYKIFWQNNLVSQNVLLLDSQDKSVALIFQRMSILHLLVNALCFE